MFALAQENRGNVDGGARIREGFDRRAGSDAPIDRQIDVACDPGQERRTARRAEFRVHDIRAAACRRARTSFR